MNWALNWRWWWPRDFWRPSHCSNRNHQVVIAKVSCVGVYWCNSDKRFTALNFIISVQYKTNIYTVLYCADYISYPWCCTVLHWRKFRIQKLFCFVLNLYEWTATALNCTDMFEYKSALYCFVLGAVNPVPRSSIYFCANSTVVQCCNVLLWP